MKKANSQPQQQPDKIEVEPGFEKRLDHLLKRVLTTPPPRHAAHRKTAKATKK